VKFYEQTVIKAQNGQINQGDQPLSEGGKVRITCTEAESSDQNASSSSSSDENSSGDAENNASAKICQAETVLILSSRSS